METFADVHVIETNFHLCEYEMWTSWMETGMEMEDRLEWGTVSCYKAECSPTVKSAPVYQLLKQNANSKKVICYSKSPQELILSKDHRYGYTTQ